MNRQAWLPRIKILLLLVLLCILVFILVFGRDLNKMYMKRARESVLKNDLQTMRMAIEKYTVDNQHLPQSLQELVDHGYLRQIPINPITHQMDWVFHYANCDLGSGKSLVCIDDVHASPGKTDSRGVPYSDW
jgi:general secretion pathway protein G